MEYSKLEKQLTTRVALGAKGKALGLKALVGASAIHSSQIAEAVEAILGAIFIDSQDHKMVSRAITKMGLVCDLEFTHRL